MRGAQAQRRLVGEVDKPALMHQLDIQANRCRLAAVQSEGFGQISPSLRPLAGGDDGAGGVPAEGVGGVFQLPGFPALVDEMRWDTSSSPVSVKSAAL